MHLSEDPPCLTHLGSNCLEIRVLARAVMMQKIQTVTAQLDQPLGIVGQSDDQRVLGRGQLRRQRHTRYIGELREALKAQPVTTDIIPADLARLWVSPNGRAR